MTTPKVILVALYLWSLFCAWAKDGQPRANYSFKDTMFSFTVVMFLLWCSGFFG